MTAIVTTDERGRCVVRYFNGDGFVGTYTALSEEDAKDFAASDERQQADRAFAAQRFRARTKGGT